MHSHGSGLYGVMEPNRGGSGRFIMAAKKAEKGGQSKAEFIRSLPSTTPASEVVAKAKAAGMSLTPQYVYNLRARANRAAGAPKRGPGRPPGSGRKAAKAAPVARSASSSNHRVEDLLRAAASELGLSHAISILQAEQAKVRALVG